MTGIELGYAKFPKKVKIFIKPKFSNFENFQKSQNFPKSLNFQKIQNLKKNLNLKQIRIF